MKKLLFCAFLVCSFMPAMSQFVQPNLPWVDLSGQKGRQIVIAQGKTDLYNGHPTSVLLDDNKTILCTWSYGHGGRAAFISKSKDGGLTWGESTMVGKMEG
ncbi:MAG: hypothetical protein RSA44_05540, partial [Bacteroides sp.]